jgi:Reverse transcriptase (RNA-dependent DNA polymerase)
VGVYDPSDHAIDLSSNSGHDNAKDGVSILFATSWNRSTAEHDDLKREIMSTEVLSPAYPRRSAFGIGIETENERLRKNMVFEKVKIPKKRRRGLNVLRSRYVLAYKMAGTREQSLLARLVVQAMRKLDNDYHSLFTYAPTVTKASTRLLLTVAGLEMDAATRGISQAYVCTTIPLLRDVYVIPPKEAKVSEDELWLLRRPLYGLPESGAIWYAAYAQHHRNKLGMRPTIVDPAAFVKHDAAGNLAGFCVIHVDDSLICGTADFLRQEEINSVAFPSKGRTMVTEMPVEFNGSVLQRTKQGFEVNQNAYVESIPSNPIPRTAADFATIRGKMAYATAKTRPALSCAINQSAQTRAELAEETDFQTWKMPLLRQKQNPLPLLFPTLDLDSGVLRVYADSSFANNRDLFPQLGCAIYLVDNDQKRALLLWSSKKARRVTRPLSYLP